MNRAIRHFIVLLVAGVTACATVRVFPEADAAGAAHAASLEDAQDIVVERGDTLYGIASRHGVAMRELAQWNALAPPYTLHAGERLRFKAPADGATQARATAPRASVSAPATPPRRADATPASQTPATSASWRWPADGVTLAREQRQGVTAPGIDIVGNAGSSVRAVADGVVLYSGAGTPGYEELIVLRHAGGWVSSYAHNRRRLVGEGQLVAADTVIAEMGRAGATRDMLHFELRRDDALVDPLKYLPRR